MSRNINWFGFAAGITTLIVLVLSYFEPWWQLTIGENLIKINASPVYTNFGVFGSQFTIPLIWALNLVSILAFAATGIIMLIYSLVPTKTYSKYLLSFSYKKPVYIVASFVGCLIAILAVAGYLGLSIPISGSATMTLPSNWTMGATISALVIGSFQLPFWLAIVTAALCITARLYHNHVGKISSTSAAIPSTETATTSI